MATDVEDAMNAYEPVHAGALALEVFSRAWFAEAGIEGIPPAGCAFLVRLSPDDGEQVDVATRNASTLYEFVANLRPHRVRVNLAPSEEAEPLLALIDRATGGDSLQ